MSWRPWIDASARAVPEPPAARRDHMSSSRPQLWRVTDRGTLQALRRGQRARRGPVTVTWLPAGPEETTLPRVAFAVGRGVGGAVTRNRIRRRLRAALRELQGRSSLPNGAYLIGATTAAAQMPWPALVSNLDEAVSAATAGARA